MRGGRVFHSPFHLQSHPSISFPQITLGDFSLPARNVQPKYLTVPLPQDVQDVIASSPSGDLIRTMIPLMYFFQHQRNQQSVAPPPVGKLTKELFSAVPFSATSCRVVKSLIKNYIPLYKAVAGCIGEDGLMTGKGLNTLSAVLPEHLENPVRATITPLALTLYMHGEDYHRFLTKIGFKKGNSGATFCRMESLPKAFRGRLIVVNLNTPKGEERSTEKILDAVNHEEIHCFETAVCRGAENYLCHNLARDLDRISYPRALGPHKVFAEKLLQTMLDISRSEMAAYGYNQENWERECLMGGFWNGHLREVDEFLKKRVSCTEDQEAIWAIYVQAEQKYWSMIDRYSPLARNSFRSRELTKSVAVSFILGTPMNNVALLEKLTETGTIRAALARSDTEI